MPMRTRYHSMVSIELGISINKDFFAWILKLYSLAYKDKHPSRPDEEYWELVKVLFRDLQYEDKEEQRDNE